MDHVLNLEFVQAHELEEAEESNLRRLLESHLALTDSPVARRLLAKRASLPFVRIQPIHFQGTIQDAWKSVFDIPVDVVPLEAPSSALCLSLQELHFFLIPIQLYSYA
jgi:hypothetical protein